MATGGACLYKIFRKSFRHSNSPTSRIISVVRQFAVLMYWRGIGFSRAGSSHVAVHIYLLRRGVSLRPGVPEIEVAMQIDFVTAIALLISVLLLVYLTATLLYPEKF